MHNIAPNIHTYFRPSFVHPCSPPHMTACAAAICTPDSSHCAIIIHKGVVVGRDTAFVTTRAENSTVSVSKVKKSLCLERHITRMERTTKFTVSREI
jgi:hypothetical protein